MYRLIHAPERSYVLLRPTISITLEALADLRRLENAWQRMHFYQEPLGWLTRYLGGYGRHNLCAWELRAESLSSAFLQHECGTLTRCALGPR